MNVQAERQSLAQCLARAAGEAADLARLSEQVERVIGGLVEANGASAQLLIEAQAADLLSQRLSGLATFVSALAAAAPADATLEIEAAIGLLPLADQARRLSGREPVESGETFSLWD